MNAGEAPAGATGAHTLAALVTAIRPDLELVASAPLAGGVSARVEAVTLRESGAHDVLTEAVLRIPPDDADLDAPAEGRLLEALAGTGMPVPDILGTTTSIGAEAPQGALLMERIQGDTVRQPSVRRRTLLAELLARLHGLPAGPFAFMPPLREHALPQLFPGLAAERMAPLLAQAQAHPPRPSGPPVLCHGDYWCGNQLWSSDDVVHLIDWEEAGFGDRLHDLAVARLEILWAAGADAMAHFTDAYLEAVPASARLAALLPAWDLRVTLLRLAWLPAWGLPEAVTRGCLELGAHHAQGAARHLRP